MEKTTNNIKYSRYPGINNVRISLYPIKGIHSLEDVDKALNELNSRLIIENIKITWGEVEYSYFDVSAMEEYDIMHLPRMFKCQSEEALNLVSEKIRNVGFKFNVSKKDLLIMI